MAAAAARPGKGDTITVTHVVNRKSYATVILVDSVRVKESGEVQITGAIKVGPQELAGIDARLDNQRQSIARLTEHLTQHCPQLAGGGMCPHIG